MERMPVLLLLEVYQYMCLIIVMCSNWPPNVVTQKSYI